MKNLLISIAFFVGTASLSGCLDLSSDTSRDVNVIGTFASPNQSFVATSYNSSGGGAAGWCYVHVNVRKQSEQFNPDSGIVFQTRCNIKPSVQWDTEKMLRIEYPSDATVYTQEKTWGSGEVEISYLPK